MSWTLVAHVHTHRSFDCMSHPRRLVKRAVALGIDVLAVTDHDTWRGAVETLGVVSGTGASLRVIVGSEVATDQGDVIGLFLKDDLQHRNALEFCDAVHAQGGLVLLPHPYRRHRLDDALLDRVDLIEVFNSRTRPTENELAAYLAEERGKPGLVGPDAHRVREIGLSRVVFEGDLPTDEDGLKHALLHAPRAFQTSPASVWADWVSQGVKLVRRPSASAAWHLARGAVGRVVKPAGYTYG